MQHIKSIESTQVKLQGDHPFPETLRGSQSHYESPRQLMTLRVSQFVLKGAHFLISIEERRHRTRGLQPRFWLLVKAYLLA